MPNRTYHIHVICDLTWQQPLADELAVFFENKAFLTYDLCGSHAQAASYSRRCIDACDYVLVILIDSYGTLNNTGVSQLHLSYLNARTRKKPMLILLKSHRDTSKLDRAFSDLLRLVEQQQHPHTHYYDYDTDLAQLLGYAYDKLLENYVGIGWIRAKNAIKTAITNAALAQTKSSAEQGMLAVTAAQAKTVTRIPPVTEKSVSVGDDGVAATDQIQVQYTAHAYEHGNLTEVSLMTELSWQHILHSLNATMPTFSLHGLQRCLNDLVGIGVTQRVKQTMPEVHAVSRCQVANIDVQRIQSQLLASQWIQTDSNSSRPNRVVWKITDQGKRIASYAAALPCQLI